MSLLPYLRLMRFHRPIGILLLFWPAMWALWLATDNHPPINIVLIFTLGVIVMRALGCVINDIADRNFDGAVARTKERPLVTGEVSLIGAIILCIMLAFGALGLVLLLNRFTILLSFAGLLLAIIYPFCKRFVPYPQFILGMAFNWSIPMAFAATQNTVPPLAWFLYCLTLLWTVVYDTQYAMVDREDDLKIGIKSTAIWFGENDINILGALHAIIIFGFILLGIHLQCHPAYWLCMMIICVLAIYQQFLLRTRQPANYFTAFLNNNWYGAVIFAGIVLR